MFSHSICVLTVQQQSHLQHRHQAVSVALRISQLLCGAETSCGPGSSVAIATSYGLDGSGIESRLGTRFFAPVHTDPGAHPASCTMGTGSFPGVKSGQGVTLIPHSLLVPWSWKGKAVPLLPLWAVRPEQSLSACTGMTFTFTFTETSYTDLSSLLWSMTVYRQRRI